MSQGPGGHRERRQEYEDPSYPSRGRHEQRQGPELLRCLFPSGPGLAEALSDLMHIHGGFPRRVSESSAEWASRSQDPCTLAAPLSLPPCDLPHALR